MSRVICGECLKDEPCEHSPKKTPTPAQNQGIQPQSATALPRAVVLGQFVGGVLQALFAGRQEEPPGDPSDEAVCSRCGASSVAFIASPGKGRLELCELHLRAYQKQRSGHRRHRR
jgi:hypothetical protein